MAELKVGDKIAVRGSRAWGGSGIEIHEILSESPTMWVTKHRRFRKENLRIVGREKWGPSSGYLPTEKDFMAVRVDRANERLRTLEATHANIDAAEEFIAACAEVAK